MRPSFVLSYVVGILAMPSSAVGAPLTWQECLDAAKKGNPELRAAQSQLRAMEYQERGAFSGFFPQASAALNYSYGSGSSTASGSGAVSLIPGGTTTAQGSWTASLSLTQNLFNGFQDAAKVRQARANRAGAEASLEATRARVSYDLKSAFAALSYAQNALKLTDEFIHRRQANLSIVELRFQSGRENKGSVQLSRAYLEQAQLDRLQAGNSLQVARAQLARVLGVEPKELAIAGSLPVETPPAEVDARAMVLGTPEYRQAEAQEKAADAAYVIARSPLFPTLNLTTTTSNTGPDFFPTGNRWAVGASLVFPFFSGGRDYYATKSASETYRAAALSRDNTLRAGATKIEQALAAYREATQRLVVDRSFATAAATRAMVAREKYNNGLLSFEDWDVIENDLIARQKSLLQTEQNRIVAEAAWDQAQGKGAFP